MSLLGYAWNRSLTSLLRGLNSVAITIAVTPVPPTRTVLVPSTKHKGRSIRCNIHEPKGATPGAPLPIHINIHGGGFILSTFTTDSEIFSPLVEQLGCIVVDADYAKAPEYPFPAGFNDILDIIAYVQSESTIFDASRMSIGGFSAGANLALAAALQLPGTFKAVVAYYPPTDHSTIEKPPHKKMGRGDPGVDQTMFRPLFRSCYIPADADTKDPRLSPVFGAVETLPPVVLITCDCDILIHEQLVLRDKIQAAGGDIKHLMIENAGHAWERMAKKGTPQYAARDEAMRLTAEQLKVAYT